MAKLGRLTVTGLLLGGTLAAAGAAPAGAAVTATASGTEVVVGATGPETVAFSCDTGSGNVLVNGSPTSPGLPCNSLTGAEVTGDGADQTVDGSGLDAPAFTMKPRLTATTGGGMDTIIGTAQPDSIEAGAGADLVVLRPSATPDEMVDLGGDGAFEYDTVRFEGTGGADAISVTRAPHPYYPFLTTEQFTGAITWSAGGPTATTTIQGAYTADIRGGAGNDALTMPNPHLTRWSKFDGGTGDDTIDLAGASTGTVTTLDGGTGTNALLGSPGSDQFLSRSSTDTIDGRGGLDNVTDLDSPRSGRTMVPGTGTYGYQLRTGGDLGVVRVRPGTAPGSNRVTSSLNRPGQLELPASGTSLQLVSAATDGPTDSSLFDIVQVPGALLYTLGRPGTQDLADITIPFGTWSRSDELGATHVTPHGEGLRPISLQDMDEVSVHGPWTDTDEGFVHRIVRDLLYTFVDDAGRAQRTAALKDGTTTRAGFVGAIMADDAYRFLEVDRVFLKHLRRGVDPTGRTYWVNALRNGRAMWRFRAQLIGSNEYFAKAGGTNAAYLEAAYTDVRGRAPDPSGRAYWTNRLDQGADRGTIALQFINAAETRRRVVDDQYLRFLDRLPTTAERNAGTALLLQGTGEQQLIRSLAVGSEYYGRS